MVYRYVFHCILNVYKYLGHVDKVDSQFIIKVFQKKYGSPVGSRH